MKRMVRSLLLLGLIATSAPAATYDLFLIPDGSSRWYEHTYGGFHQLDQYREDGTNPGNDGAYQISELPNFVPLGNGQGDAFPYENIFANIGTLTYDTGTGNITDLTLDFEPFVAPDNFAFIQAFGVPPYTTSVTNVSGSVTLDGSEVTAIDNLTSDITFTYDATGVGAGMLDYVGTFTITNNQFTLAVDDANFIAALGENYRLEWDVTGTAIPEPASGLLLLGGLGLMLRRRRR